MAGKAKPVSADGPQVLAVKLSDIDPAPAEAVRAGYDEQVVEDWSAELQGGAEFPPADVFRYGTYHALGDGGYRLRSHRAAGRDRMACRVHVCKSKDEAVRAAYAMAAGANEHHGVRRSYEDKRAAVRAVIGRPEYLAATDYEIVRLTKTSAYLVRKVRLELMAAGTLPEDAHREYKDSDSTYAARTRGEKLTTAAPDGGTVSADSQPAAGVPDFEGDGPAGVVTNSAPDPVSADGKPADVPWRARPVEACGAVPVVLAELRERYGVATLGDLADRLAKDETFGLIPHVLADLIENVTVASNWTWPDDDPPAAPVSADGPAAAVQDEKGRPVPPSLVPVFAERVWFRSLSQEVGRLKGRVRDMAATPAGAALTLNPIEVTADQLSKNVAVAMPYCVCPACSGDGVQINATCQQCSGRGWLSRQRYDQLTPDLKQVANGFKK